MATLAAVHQEQRGLVVRDVRPHRLDHADVVGHLGNGNSEAGAQRLYEMMDKIRKARTGTSKQGKQINPNKFLPT